MSDIYRVQGPLTLDTVKSQIPALDGMLAQGDVIVDLSCVTETDSSAAALLLAWCRSAKNAERTIKLVDVPEGLRRLIAVYGLGELLPLSV
ncbi:MAG: STAS domain-containing protein [Formivibrio sp.]|nr:STAS domain-containing protein [Formivibrio sp.]